MEVIDLAILLLVLWSAYHGWKQGLLKEVASLCGFFAGLLLAFLLYKAFGCYLSPAITEYTPIGSYVAKIIVFIVIWAVVPILLGVVANILTKSMRGLHLGFVNSFGGMFISVIKYLILMSFIFSAMSYMNIISKKKRNASKFYQPVSSIVSGIFSKGENPQKGKCTEKCQSDTVWIQMHHKK